MNLDRYHSPTGGSQPQRPDDASRREAGEKTTRSPIPQALPAFLIRSDPPPARVLP